MNNQILKMLNEFNKKNDTLFNKKAKLEQQILDIDIELYNLFKKFNKLIKENYEN